MTEQDIKNIKHLVLMVYSVLPWVRSCLDHIIVLAQTFDPEETCYPVSVTGCNIPGTKTGL